MIRTDTRMNFKMEESLFIYELAKTTPYSLATVTGTYLTFIQKVKKSYLPIEKKQEVFEAMVKLSINAGMSLEHCVRYYTPPLPTKKTKLFERWKVKLWVWCRR